MGVKVKERPVGSGVFWLFIDYHGKRKARKVGSQEAAQKAADLISAKLALGDEGMLEKPKVEEMLKASTVKTLSAYYSEFKETHLKTCRSSSVERADQCFRIHILPKLGDLPLDQIRRKHVKSLIAELIGKGLAKNTVRNNGNNLSSLFNTAIEDELITANPAARLGRYYKQAKSTHEEIQPLTDKEVILFLKASSARDAKKRKNAPEYYPLFLTAIHTGLRAGEMKGLKWSDLDQNGSFLTVRRSIDKDGNVNKPKNDKSRRVDMSDDLKAELEQYRKRLLERALREGRNELHEWVFPSEEGTPLDMHNVERRELQKCLTDAKIRGTRLHDLRHTFGSLLIQNGESLVYVKEQMGHASIRITVDIYGHLVPGANRQAVNRLPALGTNRA